MASIGGIASGMDTQGMLEQLMQLERQPMQSILRRQDGYRQQDDAWSQINSKMSSLRSATDTLSDGSWLTEAVTAESSNDSVVQATASGSARPGSVTFDVQQLAASHQVAFGQQFESPDSVVGDGSVTLGRDGQEDVTVELGEGASIDDAARALDGVEGISAQLLQVGEDGYRLVVTSSRSGEGGRFDLAADGFTGFDDPSQTLREGQDATINLGGDGEGEELIVRRSTNQLDDLIEGVSLRLRGTGEVTVDVEQDVDEAVETVSAFVDAANGALEELSNQTRSSSDEEGRGLLSGDGTARNLAVQLRSTISQVNGDGEYSTLGALGIELTRDGRIDFDEGRLREAVGENPDAVADLLGQSVETSDTRLQVSRVAGRTEAGEYAFDIDTAATIASRTGASYTPPDGDPKTFTIAVPGSDPVSITLDTEHGSAGDAVSEINQQLLAAGIQRIKASVGDNEEIVLAADRAGASREFTVDGSGDLDLDGTFVGDDAAGTVTVDGEEYQLEGSGQNLTLSEGPGDGLLTRVPTDTAGDFGTVSIGDGLGATMDRFLQTVEGSDGSIARARESLESRIEAQDTSLENFERRLETRERSLRRQFTALETAMADAQQQSQWMQSQMGGLM